MRTISYLKKDIIQRYSTGRRSARRSKIRCIEGIMKWAGLKIKEAALRSTKDGHLWHN